MRDLVMNVCPDCRAAISDRYALWAQDIDPARRRECDICAYRRTYLGYAYELESRSLRRPHAGAASRPASANDKKEYWREFRENIK